MRLCLLPNVKDSLGYSWISIAHVNGNRSFKTYIMKVSSKPSIDHNDMKAPVLPVASIIAMAMAVFSLVVLSCFLYLYW